MTLGVGMASTFVLMRFLSWRRKNSHQYCKLAPRLVYFDLFTLFQVIFFLWARVCKKVFIETISKAVLIFTGCIMQENWKYNHSIVQYTKFCYLWGFFLLLLKKNELEFMLERSFLCHFLSFGVQCVYLVFILQVWGCKCTNLCQLDSWSIRTTCLLLLFCTLWGWFPTKSAKEKSWKYWGKQ